MHRLSEKRWWAVWVVLAGLGLCFRSAMSHAALSDAASAPATPVQPAAASTSQPSDLALPAIIIPDEQVDIHAKASGYISKISVDYGSKVHRGDVLIELDIPELRDDVAQAEATVNARKARVQSLQAKAKQSELLIQSAKAERDRYMADQDLAKITFQRKSELHQGKAIPEQEFDVARSAVAIADAQVLIGKARVAAAEGDLASALAEVKESQAQQAVAEADLARAQTLLGYTRILAPFDGIVTQRNVDHGAFVRSAAQSAGSPLLVLDKVDRVRLAIDVPEVSAPQVQTGTPATIQIRSLGDGTLSVPVTRTALAIQPNSRTMRAEIDIDNRDGRLMPGMYARVQLAVRPR